MYSIYPDYLARIGLNMCVLSHHIYSRMGVAGCIVIRNSACVQMNSYGVYDFDLICTPYRAHFIPLCYYPKTSDARKQTMKR